MVASVAIIAIDAMTAATTSGRDEAADDAVGREG
jgi:hypothetical protein